VNNEEKGGGYRVVSLLQRAKRAKDSQDFSGRLVTVLKPSDVASEAYRTLRTNLLFHSVSDAQRNIVVLTSPGPREGKSITCANLGVVLAQAGRKTLLVDCDLRKPVLHKIFGHRNVQGLMNVLAGERDLQEVAHEPLENLEVLSAGPMPPNPAEVLSSYHFAEFCDQAREQFDYVLVDAPPTRSVSDPAILASLGDATLVVVDAQNTRKASVRKAVRDLQAVGANVIGTVMNNVKGYREEHPYYAYYIYK